MSPTEAKYWLDATARSRTEWQLDQIHCTFEDALIYKGGQVGFYVNLRRLYADKRQKQPLPSWGVEIGTYQDALPHIGEAAFTVGGRKHFSDPRLALKFIGDK